MRTKTISAVTLVLPFMLLGCDRNDTPSPTSTGPSEERQAMAPGSSPERMMENAPPAAGTPRYAEEPAPSSDASPATAPAESPATPQR